MVPEDVLVKIASMLDLAEHPNLGNRSRLSMSRVCKHWNRIVSNTPACWERGKTDLLNGMTQKDLQLGVWSNQASIRSAIRMFDLKLSDFCKNQNLLKFIAENGPVNNVSLLHALVDDLGLTADNVRELDNYVLRHAVKMRRTDVLEVLAQKLCLTAQDARALDNEALILAASNGSFDVLQVLIYTFGLTTADVRARDSTALKIAADRGYAASLWVLISVFNLPRMETLMQSCHADLPRSGWYQFPRIDYRSYCNYILSIFNQEIQKSRF